MKYISFFWFSDSYQQGFRHDNLKSPTSPMSRCFSESDLSLPPPKPPRSYNRRSQIDNSNNQTYPRPSKLRLLELLHSNLSTSRVLYICVGFCQLAVGPFYTWLITSWEENRCCNKLSKCTKWKLFRSKFSKLSFWCENSCHFVSFR